MRKDAKTQKPIQTGRIQGYHERGLGGNYATQGFARQFQGYASDRPKPITEGFKGVGLEIELASRLNSERALAFIIERGVFEHFPAGLFKQQHDGSLGGNTSSEVITQPMTKAFIRNHYNDFKSMWEFLKAMDTAPDNSCGMHTNISMCCFGKTRPQQEKAILRLHNWMSDNYGLACAVLKRDINYTSYCNRMRRMDSLEAVGSHGTMMNYSHINEGVAGRVEIRLVGPQKTFGSFRNTLEVVFHLIEAAKEGRNMNDAVKLWAGCNECVLDRLADLYTAGLLPEEQFRAIKARAVDEGIRAATR